MNPAASSVDAAQEEANVIAPKSPFQSQSVGSPGGVLLLGALAAAECRSGEVDGGDHHHKYMGLRWRLATARCQESRGPTPSGLTTVAVSSASSDSSKGRAPA